MSIIAEKQFIIFSIGNPGPINRHSTGHLVLKELIEYFDAKQLVKPLSNSMYSMTEIDNLALVKSNSYINDSSKLLKQYIEQERIGLAQAVLVILYDEFDLDLGKVRISQFKKNESHNGVRSLKEYISRQPSDLRVYKLGIGIGPKPSNATTSTMSSWVLSNYKPEEREIIDNVSIPLAIDYIDHIIDANGEIPDCSKLNASFTKRSKLQA
ncbi:uncharacterized protein AC631_01199 [Debaryomyces fabryi]|uniref:Peptidyl-tRNA hydrolase n=1 Tax=Debaryomyces fabryi TaxID=58627 RepID=A0A0V1Q3N1_9ASCO|nr:uncharacterized protein AC631_01199 [Debaryomyces fabryi]KSA03065.1 hypothetical protein AC631_01199 [Debaryomyces fabryi]CUM49127.1 unnamed protein product [Debaryomyces fabryi]